MAPYKNLKTYQRKDRNVTTNSSKSVEVINELFAKNISKRFAHGTTKKSPLKIEELPPRTENYAQTSDSIQVSAEDTFDKLIAGPKYNAVKITDSFHKVITTSESDASIAKTKSIHVSHKIHKPTLKRRRRKPKPTLVEVDDTREKSTPSPLPPLVVDTDTVFPELSVELVQKHKGFVQDSFEASIGNDTLFTESFRQRLAQKPTLTSSTPVVHAARKNILNNVISPIEKVSLIEKSYDEIKKWDLSFPQTETPKLPSESKKGLPKFVAKRRKSKSCYKYSDWKLYCQPKVYLNRLKNPNIDKLKSKRDPKAVDNKICVNETEGNFLVEGKSELDEVHKDKKEVTEEATPELDEVHEDEKEVTKEATPELDEVHEDKKEVTKEATPELDEVHEDEKEVTEEATPELDEVHVEINSDREHSYALPPDFTPPIPPLEPVDNQTPHLPIQMKLESDSEDWIDEVEESIISLDDDSWMGQLANKTDLLKKNITKRRQRKQSFDMVDEAVEIETVPVYGREHLSETEKSSETGEPQRTPERRIDQRVERRTKQFIAIFHDHSYSASPVMVASPKETPKKKPEKKSKVKVAKGAKKTKGKQKEKEKAKAIDEPPGTMALPSMYEPSALNQILDLEEVEERERLTLEVAPGKKYRRSLAQVVAKSICTGQPGCVCQNCAKKCNRISRHPRLSSVRIVPAPSEDFSRRSVLQLYAQCYAIKEEPDRTADLEDSVRSLSLINSTETCIINDTTYDSESLSARDIILQRCGQREPLPFDECYPSSLLVNCHKIGEGVYGEVFLYRNPKGGTTVMKIIPIEGSQIINGEHQKKFSDILSEVVVTMELSNLRQTGRNTTTCFCQVQQIRCVKGRYPDRLIELWDIYDENRGSENDSPLTFNSQQLYIILELVNGGTDLEAFSFNNALQAYSMFRQLATALAVAENQLKFEHRDLHWGNVLINEVEKNKVIDFCLNGEDVQFISYGVEVCVIDFTLSRIEHDGVVIYLDLSQDPELFMAKGDYQFDIYRLMQENNENEWEHFEPFSNVLWLHYVLDKCVGHLRYKNTKSKTHKDFLEKLKSLKDTILKHRSVHSFVTETLTRQK